MRGSNSKEIEKKGVEKGQNAPNRKIKCKLTSGYNQK